MQEEKSKFDLAQEAVEMVEVPWKEGARLIDECTYLFATEVVEPEELTLRLTIVEAKAQAPIPDKGETGPLAMLRMDARPIKTDETCRIFQLRFERNAMISYTVLNESYGRYPELPEVFSGNLFRVFSHSHLLEFTKQTTNASDDFPGRLMHFEIACLNHIFGVICTAPPTISVGRRMTTPDLVN